MAIIQCPACGQRISSLHSACPECHADLKAGSMSVLTTRRRVRDKLYRARMGGFAALGVMMLAILVWWIPSEGFVTAPAEWLQVVFILGAVGYLVSRYFLMAAKRELRDLEE